MINPNNLYPGSWYSYEEVSKMLRNKKENNMENIFVCIGDDKYRPRTITSTISTGGAAEFDIETTVSSYFKCNPYEPVKVIFNDPATIVFWGDGTKTVVKCTNEDFDPEKGLAMAIAKKALGNKRDYYEVFKKWVPEEEEEVKEPGVKSVYEYAKEFEEELKLAAHKALYDFYRFNF